MKISQRKGRIFYLLLIGPDISLLEKNLHYYSTLGVNKILLSVHVYGEQGKKLLDAVPPIAKRYHAVIADLHNEQRINESLRYSRVRSRHCQEDDWIIYADIDEFIQFPIPVPEIICLADEKQFDYIHGRFLDRISAEGDFPQLTENEIWDQFPLGVRLTREICKGNERKVTLARAWVVIANGHHYAKSGKGCPRELCMSIVHHFKWDNSVILRCLEMAAMYKETGLPWGEERKRFIDYYNAGNGLLDLCDPALETFWPAYKRTLSHSVQKPSSCTISTDPNLLFPLQKAGTSVRPLENDLFMIENETPRCTVQVNAVSRLLFELADGQKSIHRICSQLESSFPHYWWKIERDVQDGYRSLWQAGVIVMQDSAVQTFTD